MNHMQGRVACTRRVNKGALFTRRCRIFTRGRESKGERKNEKRDAAPAYM